MNTQSGSEIKIFSAECDAGGLMFGGMFTLSGGDRR